MPRAQIPIGESADGLVTARVIAGRSLGAEAVIDTVTPITLLHLTLQPGGAIRQSLPREHNAGAFVFAGEVEIGEASRRVSSDQLAILDDGDRVTITHRAEGGGPAELLLFSGLPLHEPVARYGPFVMNTPEEIDQALVDYEQGRLGKITA